MYTSYQIAESVNFQSALFALAGAVYNGAVAVRAALPGLLAALRVLCVALIVAFAYVTYPRSSKAVVA